MSGGAETLNDGFNILGIVKRIPLTTLVIGGLYIIVLIVGVAIGFSLPEEISLSLQRFGMWGLFVLAMVPSIQSGTGPNFALPVGICAGLLAFVLTIEWGFTGYALLVAASALAIVFGCISGYLYGKLMNMVKGSEMAIATYTGFSITYLFCMVWLVLPYSNAYLGFFLGDGIRHIISLEPMGAQRILEELWAFEVLGITFRTGTLLVIAVACTLMWLFFRSRAGIAISAVGMNPVFARAAGLNVDRSRIIANMISTSLGAVGIVVYAQAFGFIQVYDFPLLLAFPAVAAIMVGGASAQRSKIMHVIIGTFLFQGLITVAPPVAGRLLQGTDADIANPVRMIIQNGVILYALTQLKGGSK